MSSWRTSAPSSQAVETGPRAKCDQVVFEAISKAAEIVVGSRCWIDGGANTSNPGLGSGASSSRFNLLVPEVQGVRSILERWKRALHVPLRLDVYYQHPDQRRELLERWCLEYAPLPFHQPLDVLSADPIVQLRHVCKKIVIWLRTLYCWSRMLPAQILRDGATASSIGFSIYVVSEGKDDVSPLVSNQGFSAQGQPSGVATPYGELGWKVFYAPKEMIDRLYIPRNVTAKAKGSLSAKSSQRSVSRPIPYSSQRRPSAEMSPTSRMTRRDTLPENTAQSAPQNSRPFYHRSHSAAPYHSPQSHHLDPSPIAQQNLRNRHHPFSVHEQTNLDVHNDSGDPPPKTLSGLSLAMMLNDENAKEPVACELSNQGEAMLSSTHTDQAEKRRAALHHAPPHMNSISNVNTTTGDSSAARTGPATANDYGYAYNNHIPWQQIRPSHNAPTGNRMSPLNTDRTSSPSSFQVGTPPGYLGATPPKGGFLGSATPTINPAMLIPPRSSVTPPFVRPAGFVSEPSNDLFQTSNMGPSTLRSSRFPDQPHANWSRPQQPPTATSLDLLHSSPFQQPPGTSVLSSLSVYDPTNAASMFSGDLRTQSEHNLHPFEDFYNPQSEDADDMPFAVDPISNDVDADPTSSKPGTGPGNTTMSSLSSQLGSSSAVASFAQRCATGNRLSLFDNVDRSGMGSNNDAVSSLADQLAEFKSFGASLMIGSDSGGSTSTPLSLRS